MKPVKWTKEKVTELSSLYKGPIEFKKANPSAYKAMRRYGLAETLYPLSSRERKPEFTEQALMDIMAVCSSRTEFQVNHASAYNAARRLCLISKAFPTQKNKKKWNKQALMLEARKYDNRSEFYNNSPGAHSVACKLGLLDEICPPKMQGLSRAEIELLEFLKTLVPDFKSKRFANDYELDCYSETLKLGVEYNGLYWHSDTNKHKNYHYKKTKYFESLGIRVIHIWEHEWRDRKGPVQNYLSSACKANTLRLGARKCEFVELDSKEARRFLDKTHIQGAPRDIQLAIGAMWQGTLVSVASFGRHHRQGFDHVKVLNRFSCLPGVTVSGGLAKMTKLAYKKLGKLISWAHYAKSQAGGYLAAGWVIVKAHGPDYFYADDQGRVIPKQSRRKNSIDTPKGMTEIEHARLDGLYRVWDCGKILLEYDPGKKLIKIT